MTTPIVPSITDEQLAELEDSVVSSLSDPELSDKDVATVMAIGGIIARLRSAEKDAGRYRWLRERSGVLPEDCKTIWVLMDGCSMTDLERQETDQAIDTAMEQQP